MDIASVLWYTYLDSSYDSGSNAAERSKCNHSTFSGQTLSPEAPNLQTTKAQTSGLVTTITNIILIILIATIITITISSNVTIIITAYLQNLPLATAAAAATVVRCLRSPQRSFAWASTRCI